jgi:hypothetical protein
VICSLRFNRYKNSSVSPNSCNYLFFS